MIVVCHVSPLVLHAFDLIWNAPALQRVHRIRRSWKWLKFAWCVCVRVVLCDVV